MPVSKLADRMGAYSLYSLMQMHVKLLVVQLHAVVWEHISSDIFYSCSFSPGFHKDRDRDGTETGTEGTGQGHIFVTFLEPEICSWHLINCC